MAICGQCQSEMRDAKWHLKQPKGRLREGGERVKSWSMYRVSDHLQFTIWSDFCNRSGNVMTVIEHLGGEVKGPRLPGNVKVTEFGLGVLHRGIS